MRVLFTVQGEGRGHLTQAISPAQLLRQSGHTVVGAWVNVANGRPVPAFFTEQFTAPVTPVEGPLLVYGLQLPKRATVARLFDIWPCHGGPLW